MELLLGVLGTVAGVTCLICSIWLLVIAFRTNVMWGLAYLFIPFAALVFVFMNWDKTRKPFLIFLGGMAVVACVAAMVPSTLGHMFELPNK